MDINITADDGTNTPTTQAFTIAVITDIPDITPVIKQFTVTQGNNQASFADSVPIKVSAT
jgi:hypothetical protein